MASQYFIRLSNSADPTSRLEFDPPLGSDQLHDALKVAFPLETNLNSRVAAAVCNFYATAHKFGFDLASTGFGSASAQIPMSSPEYLPSPSSSFPSSMSTPMVHSISQSPLMDSIAAPKQEDMMGVWSLPSNPDAKIHKRRKMTKTEKDAYRAKRAEGACADCRRKRRKCAHGTISSVASSSTRKTSNTAQVENRAAQPSANTTTTFELPASTFDFNGFNATDLPSAGLDFDFTESPIEEWLSTWSSPETALANDDLLFDDFATYDNSALFSSVSSNVFRTNNYQDRTGDVFAHIEQQREIPQSSNDGLQVIAPTDQPVLGLHNVFRDSGTEKRKRTVDDLIEESPAAHLASYSLGGHFDQTFDDQVLSSLDRSSLQPMNHPRSQRQRQNISDTGLTLHVEHLQVQPKSSRQSLNDPLLTILQTSRDSQGRVNLPRSDTGYQSPEVLNRCSSSSSDSEGRVTVPLLPPDSLGRSTGGSQDLPQSSRNSSPGDQNILHRTQSLREDSTLLRQKRQSSPTPHNDHIEPDSSSLNSSDVRTTPLSSKLCAVIPTLSESGGNAGTFSASLKLAQSIISVIADALTASADMLLLVFTMLFAFNLPEATFVASSMLMMLFSPMLQSSGSFSKAFVSKTLASKDYRTSGRIEGSKSSVSRSCDFMSLVPSVSSRLMVSCV